jgi:hypothetical protein
MNEFIHICANCEFWEKHRDRANTGDCLLDIYGDDGLEIVKANDTCSYWMNRSDED